MLGSTEVPEGQKMFEGRAAESPKVCVGWDGDVVTLDLVIVESLGFVPACLEFCIERSRVGLDDTVLVRISKTQAIAIKPNYLI